MKPEGGRGYFRFWCRLSLCLSVRPSVCQSTRCPSIRFSEVFSVVLWDIDLKFGMWICLDIIQVKFEFCRAWLTFTGVIALCWNLVFRVFLSRLLRYWLEIWYMNSSWYNTDQVRVSLRLTCFYRSYCPLLKFSFLDFSLLSFEILTWNLVYMNLSWHNTDQVRLSSRLTYFYRSYCPLLKFSFPDFSLLSFEILTWNLVYEFVMT